MSTEFSQGKSEETRLVDLSLQGSQEEAVLWTDLFTLAREKGYPLPEDMLVNGGSAPIAYESFERLLLSHDLDGRPDQATVIAFNSLMFAKSLLHGHGFDSAEAICARNKAVGLVLSEQSIAPGTKTGFVTLANDYLVDVVRPIEVTDQSPDALKVIGGMLLNTVENYEQASHNTGAIAALMIDMVEDMFREEGVSLEDIHEISRRIVTVSIMSATIQHGQRETRKDRSGSASYFSQEAEQLGISDVAMQSIQTFVTTMSESLVLFNSADLYHIVQSYNY